MLGYHEDEKQTGILLYQHPHYNCIEESRQYEEEMRCLFENIDLESKFSQFLASSLPLSRQDREEQQLPLVQLKEPRRPFRIGTNTNPRSELQPPKKIIDNATFKKWSQVLKLILKQSKPDWSMEEAMVLQQFYFNLNIGLNEMRRLFGFTRVERNGRVRYEEVGGCRRIRHHLLSMVDSARIVEFIDKSKSSKEAKRKLIMSLLIMRDFILDPTIPVTII